MVNALYLNGCWNSHPDHKRDISKTEQDSTIYFSNTIGKPFAQDSCSGLLVRGRWHFTCSMGASTQPKRASAPMWTASDDIILVAEDSPLRGQGATLLV